MAENQANLINDEISERIISITEQMAMNNGADSVTVRAVLKEMGVTNRVFYNRFHNIDEVLEIVYRRTVTQMHDCLISEYDLETDFYNYVIDVAVKVLVKTYDLKNQFSQYMFEFDSSTDANRVWWIKRIKEIIEDAKRTGQLGDVDSELLSYAIWSFFRGYNADAVKRRLSKEDAVRSFKYGLTCLFEGIRNI